MWAAGSRLFLRWLVQALLRVYVSNWEQVQGAGWG